MNSTESTHSERSTDRSAPESPEELADQWAQESPPPAGPIANAASSIVCIALGVAAMIIAVGLGLGTVSEPEPGMWPFLIGLVITVLSCAQLIAGRRGESDGEQFSRHSWYAAGLLTLLAMVWLMPRVGFEIPGLLLCFIWMKFLGGESWRAAALYSSLVIVGFYTIFVGLLRTSIPHLF